MPEVVFLDRTCTVNAALVPLYAGATKNKNTFWPNLPSQPHRCVHLQFIHTSRLLPSDLPGPAKLSRRKISHWENEPSHDGVAAESP